MLKLQINVTKDILERSKMCGKITGKKAYNVAANCAIALAVRDIFPNALVGKKSLVFNVPDSTTIVELNKLPKSFLPIAAMTFIDVFDTSTSEQRIQLEPFSFEVEVPDEVIDSINIEEVKAICASSETLMLVEN